MVVVFLCGGDDCMVWLYAVVVEVMVYTSSIYATVVVLLYDCIYMCMVVVVYSE